MRRYTGSDGGGNTEPERDLFTSTQGQSEFELSGPPSRIARVNLGRGEDLFQEAGDYTVDGSILTLTEPLSVGVQVVVEWY